MAEPVVSSIEIGCVSSVDVPHDLGEVSLWSGQHQVIVVAHETTSMDDGLVTCDSDFKEPKNPLSFFISSTEDLISFVAPRCDVLEGTGVCYSQWSCHLCSKNMPKRPSLSRV